MTSLDPLLIPEVEQERASAIPVAQAGARYPLKAQLQSGMPALYAVSRGRGSGELSKAAPPPCKAQLHAREIHRRLRNPANAVADVGIDLRRHLRPDTRKPWFSPWLVDITPKKLQLPVDNPEIINKIIEIICRKYNQTPESILHHCRKAKPSDARHIGMWLAYKVTNYNLCIIANYFFRSDHSVSYYAIHKVEARRRSWPAFAAETDQLLAEVRA